VSAVDHLVCGGALGASVATGLLRLTAEQHYATDVLAAWSSGALFGYILPVWFDYGSRPRRQNPVTQSLQPLMRGNAMGLQYSLTF
jgi:membrane-associated phospholipid phosphatase